MGRAQLSRLPRGRGFHNLKLVPFVRHTERISPHMGLVANALNSTQASLSQPIEVSLFRWERIVHERTIPRSAAARMDEQELFAFGECGRPFRFFWQRAGQFYGRELTVKKTVRFCN